MRCRGKEYRIITAAAWLKLLWEHKLGQAGLSLGLSGPSVNLIQTLMPSNLFNIISSLLHIQDILDWFLSKFLMSMIMYPMYFGFYKQGLSAP